MTFQRNRNGALALGVIVFLAIAAHASAINGTPTWLQSSVHASQASSYVSSPVLAFDHYGMPAISWSFVSTGGGNNTVYQSQLSGLALWAHREIVTGQGIGLRTAQAFDRAERPAVAWINADGALKAQFNYGQIQQIATNPGTSPPILSLGYDLAGDLRGMYGLLAPPSGGFSSIGYSGGTFSSSSLVTVPGAGVVQDATMATDHRGLRQLAIRQGINSGANGAVLLASEMPGGVWASGVIATARMVNGLDIAIDPTDGRPALAYTTYDESPNRWRLYYAKFNGSSLQTTQILSSTTDSFEDVSLAFDLADGRPAIAFERRVSSPAANQLQFTYLNASSQWLTSVVDDSISKDSPTGMPRRPSLAFDDYGTSWPAIAYVDADDSLKVAFDPPTPEPATMGLLAVGLALAGRRRSRR